MFLFFITDVTDLIAVELNKDPARVLISVTNAQMSFGGQKDDKVALCSLDTLTVFKDMSNENKKSFAVKIVDIVAPEIGLDREKVVVKFGHIG